MAYAVPCKALIVWTIGAVIVCAILIHKNCQQHIYPTHSIPFNKYVKLAIGSAVGKEDKKENNEDANVLSTIEMLVVKCDELRKSSSNGALRSICADIRMNFDEKKMDKVSDNVVYLSMLLEDVDNSENDIIKDLRAYVDAVVSSTASV